MFGHRMFGRRFYGPRYFGDGGTGTPVETSVAGYAAWQSAATASSWLLWMVRP